MSTATASLIQNAHRPEGWKDAAPFPPSTSTTFAKQESLPKLPLPDFDLTIGKLKTSLKALAWSDEEFKATEKKIDDFAKDGGIGRTLQGMLKARKESEGMKHWLEEFWDNAAYLKYRDSVMVNVSYYYGFHHPPHLPQTPLAKAASLTRTVLLQRRLLKQGNMPTDMSRKDPLCMDTWRWMFDCCRIPGLEGADWSVTGAKPGDDGNEGHIVVFRKNVPWKVDISANGRLLSTSELEKRELLHFFLDILVLTLRCRQFKQIYDAPVTSNVEPIGLLTSNDRDTWAKDYANLLAAGPQNAKNLETIASAAFVVCLDTAKPKDIIEHSKTLFHGGEHGEHLGNRWLDKPAQIIVCDNGEAGYMGEHSVMDGTPSVTMMDAALSALSQVDFDHSSPSSSSSEPPKPEPLSWTITPEIKAAIPAARKAAEVIVSRQAMGMLLTSYGRDAIKQFGFSPDAWAQMIVQLAYHRLLPNGRKREGGTYEAASTRGFLKGRTETIRIVTEEALRWCDSMDDKSVDVEERRKLFKEAAKKHRVDADDAVKAMGIDRHLFGLRNMVQAPSETMHELFSDPLYVRGATWIVSTSAIFSPHFTRGYGWGEVVPNGFGVAYMTGFPDRLQFTVTSRTDQPNAKFVAQLEKASEDLRTLFEGQGTSAKKSHL